VLGPLLVAGMITPPQLRAARALLGWSREDLATSAGVSAITIKDFENGHSDPRISTVNALKMAVMQGGVVLLEPTDEHDGGVALRRIAHSRTAQESRRTG